MSDSKNQQLWDACTSGDLDLVKLLVNDPAVDVNWGDPELNRTPFFRACGHNAVTVVEFLLKHPRVEINKPTNQGGGAFNIACQQGCTGVVSLLLNDPRINVNHPGNNGASPFNIACQNGRQDVVSLLLADMRIDINFPNNNTRTPLWFASHHGFLPMVQVILVSGREVDTKTKSMGGEWNDKTAADIARYHGSRAVDHFHESEGDYTRRKRNGPMIANWLDSYDVDAITTRQQLRELPELRDSFTSDLFALVIFLCDGLLTTSAGSSASPSHEKAVRFFQSVQCLPMELQMVLCNRAFGAGKDHILTKHSEPAFKKLGKLLTRSPTH